MTDSDSERISALEKAERDLRRERMGDAALSFIDAQFQLARLLLIGNAAALTLLYNAIISKGLPMSEPTKVIGWAFAIGAFAGFAAQESSRMRRVDVILDNLERRFFPQFERTKGKEDDSHFRLISIGLSLLALGFGVTAPLSGFLPLK